MSVNMTITALKGVTHEKELLFKKVGGYPCE